MERSGDALVSDSDESTYAAISRWRARSELWTTGDADADAW